MIVSFILIMYIVWLKSCKLWKLYFGYVWFDESQDEHDLNRNFFWKQDFGSAKFDSNRTFLVTQITTLYDSNHGFHLTRIIALKFQISTLYLNSCFFDPNTIWISESLTMNFFMMKDLMKLLNTNCQFVFPSLACLF